MAKIKARIDELRAEAASALTMTKREILERHSEIARARLTDFMELGQDGSWVNIGPETLRAAALQEIHSRTEYDDNGSHPTVYTSVKLHDPTKSMSEICKILGFYNQPETSQTINTIMNIIVIDEETKGLIAQVKERTGKLLEANHP